MSESDRGASPSGRRRLRPPDEHGGAPGGVPGGNPTLVKAPATATAPPSRDQDGAEARGSYGRLEDGLRPEPRIRGPLGPPQGEEPEDDEGMTLGQYALIAGILVAVAIALYVGTRVFVGGGDAGQEEAPRSAAEAGSEAGSPEAGGGDALGSLAEGVGREVPVEPTGIVYEVDYSAEKDGVREVEIVARGGAAEPGGTDPAWAGTVTRTEDGETWELQGTTFARYHDGFDLEDGSEGSGVAEDRGAVMFGNMAVAPEDEPITHATIHRVEVAGQWEMDGTYFYFDEQGVEVDGAYFDERAEGGNEVVRTYVEPRPGGVRQFAKSYKAPPEIPIPDLPGWEPPQDAADEEAAG